MLYIKNKVKYPLAFKIVKNGKEEKIVFDCLRVFRDTGNIATTGITPVSEEDFEALNKLKIFQKHFEEGLLEKTVKQETTAEANRNEALAKENEVLKKQLAEKDKESKKLDETKAENENLKKQLEALQKGKTKGKSKDKVDETEGF